MNSKEKTNNNHNVHCQKIKRTENLNETFLFEIPKYQNLLYKRNGKILFLFQEWVEKQV